MTRARRPPPELFRYASNAWTQPFWDATLEHRLVVPGCGACATLRMPPTPFCPVCRSQAVVWKTLSGFGSVYSYTVVERGILPGMEHHLPYVPAVIELDGGPGIRMVSNLVDMELGDLRIGMPVKVVWDAHAVGVNLPRFVLA